MGQAIQAVLLGKAQPKQALDQAADQVNQCWRRERDRGRASSLRARRLAVRPAGHAPDRRLRAHPDRLGDAALAPAQRPADGADVGRPRELPCAYDDPVFRVGRRTIVYTAAVRAALGGRRAGRRAAAERADPFNRFYRTAVFVPGGDLDRGDGDHLQLAARPTYGSPTTCSARSASGPYGFFQDPDQALYAIVAMTVWGWLGFDVIIYLAALQGVPGDLLEAAGSTAPAAGRRSGTSCSRCSRRRRCS